MAGSCAREVAAAERRDRDPDELRMIGPQLLVVEARARPALPTGSPSSTMSAPAARSRKRAASVVVGEVEHDAALRRVVVPPEQAALGSRLVVEERAVRAARRGRRAVRRPPRRRRGRRGACPPTRRARWRARRRVSAVQPDRSYDLLLVERRDLVVVEAEHVAQHAVGVFAETGARRARSTSRSPTCAPGCRRPGRRPSRCGGRRARARTRSCPGRGRCGPPATRPPTPARRRRGSARAVVCRSRVLVHVVMCASSASCVARAGRRASRTPGRCAHGSSISAASRAQSSSSRHAIAIHSSVPRAA